MRNLKSMRQYENPQFDAFSSCYKSVINYFMKTSDKFAVTAKTKKPYTKETINYVYPEIIEKWNFCLLESRRNVLRYDFTGYAYCYHCVMNFYSCKQFRKNVLDFPNFFDRTALDKYEDICFYRNDKPWFWTLTHEDMFFKDESLFTKEDEKFFNEIWSKI